MPDVPLRYFSFRLPRRGHPVEECDDACAADAARGRFAVADGAAESAAAGVWARLLVEAFVTGEDLPPWPGWVVGAQGRWQEQSGPPPEALPWYLEERQRQGAFATFVGLALDGAKWQAVAVGDSCLFHVRDGRLEGAFPLTHSAQFDNAPWLIGSLTDPAKVPLQQGGVLAGEARPGDRFWLMTDALAQWFLAAAEAGGRPWDELEGLAGGSEEAFATWVEERRAARALRNDDTTLVGVLL